MMVKHKKTISAKGKRSFREKQVRERHYEYTDGDAISVLINTLSVY